MRTVTTSLIKHAVLVSLALPACGAGGTGMDAAAGDAAVSPEAGACPTVETRNGPFARLTVGHAPQGMGINDPSVEYLPGPNLWLMAYTAVVPNPLYQHIAMASSKDSGSTWSYLGDVTSASSTITITTTNLSICGKTTCTGTWGQESPGLLFDEFDPDPNRRFKVFAHAYYFDLIGDRQMDIGYLALYTAKDVTGPWTETKLFGWPSSSPLSNQGVVYDISRDRALGLGDCVIVGEPAPLVRAPGTIDLALSCPKGTTDIRLLRSQDHGKTWSLVGTLLTAEDGPKLGSQTKDITGADLFYAQGAYHLIVSPFGTIQGPGGETFSGYHGCLAVAMADLDHGQVARCNGSPVVEASYLGLPGQFMGACSAAEGLTGSGMLIPIPDLSLIPASGDLPPNTEVWQLFGSGTIPFLAARAHR